MSLPLFLSLAATGLFGALSVFFSLKEERIRKRFKEDQASGQQKLYQITVLKEIQDRIGYSLDIEKVIDVITGSLANLFPYSTASSMVVKQDAVVFKTYVAQSVSRRFVESVKQSMLASLSSLIEQLPATVDESLSGIVLDDTNTRPVASFFHIPLIIQGKVVGLINVSSVEPNLYKENEMTVLYQIVETASNALSRLQNVLQTEKGKLMAMIGSLSDGVFMIDSQNQLLVINESARTFMHLASNTPTVIDIYSFFNAFYPLSDKIKQAIAKKEIIEEKEITLNDKVVQLFIHPVLDDVTGQMLGASILLHDITLEKNLASMKEDFTNMMVHELRAPLTAIKGSISLLRKDKDKMSPAEQEKFLTIVGSESDRLLNQVASLLDAAKLEAGKMTLLKKPADLNALILEKVQMFHPQADEKNIIMHAHLDKTLPVFSFDPIRMGQVLNNLLSNALKYTKAGSVTITTQQTGDSVKITISDTGVGIPKAKQDNLFSKFYQAGNPSATMTGSANSTGLGLYITKGILEAHNGTISVASEEQKGTTFTISLPLEQPQHVQHALEPVIPTPPVSVSSAVN